MSPSAHPTNSYTLPGELSLSTTQAYYSFLACHILLPLNLNTNQVFANFFYQVIKMQALHVHRQRQMETTT